MYDIIKRVIDFCAAFLLLIVLFPIFILTAVLIKIIDKEEVFFRQKRPGKYGRIFVIYKFKTMQRDDSESKTDIQRTTKLGAILRKLSIDELPQLINILNGDMSFIGPRPLLVRYLQYYSSEQMRRHNVLPGISGYAQVNGRNAITWDERFELDVYYVDNISFILDVKILLKTITSVLNGNGVNKSKAETMTFFDEEKRSKS